jgi:hypothetical protein
LQNLLEHDLGVERQGIMVGKLMAGALNYLHCLAGDTVSRGGSWLW